MPQSATGAAGYSVYYGYDVRGLQAWARFGSDSGPGVANAYDGFGRLKSSATSVDGTPLGYSYDAAGRLTGLNEGVHPIADLHYDAAGRRSSLGLGYDSFPSTAAYGYDAVGRLQNLTHHLAGNGNDEALTFDYNPASQIVRRTSSNAAYASNTALAVDRTYAVNGLNQYTGTTSNGTSSATFSYDANGNLTGDGSNAYVYDAENRLVSQRPVGGNVAVTLAYDPMGRLRQVTSLTSVTRFLYDGDRLVIEYDGAGTLLRSYDHGASPDEPLVWYEAASGGTSRRYLHADHQGSIIAVADQNGNPIAINAYDVWGIPNSDNIGRFGYTGQAWLPELGMWYYKARIYSPTLGRFLQTDPVGYKDQINLYAYVGNDPVDGRDPTGNCRIRDGDGECVVTNKAGKAGEVAASHLQTQVRRVDHAIRSLDPKAKLRVDVGHGKTKEMTGKEITRAWARTTWSVDPDGTTYANGMGGQMDHGDFSSTVSALEGHRDSARDWKLDEDEATRSVVLHDFAHSTPIGEKITKMYGNTEFDAREQAASRTARGIGAMIGESFECRTFYNGC